MGRSPVQSPRTRSKGLAAPRDHRPEVGLSLTRGKVSGEEERRDEGNDESFRAFAFDSERLRRRVRGAEGSDAETRGGKGGEGGRRRGGARRGARARPLGEKKSRGIVRTPVSRLGDVRGEWPFRQTEIGDGVFLFVRLRAPARAGVPRAPRPILRRAAVEAKARGRASADDGVRRALSAQFERRKNKISARVRAVQARRLYGVASRPRVRVRRFRGGESRDAALGFTPKRVPRARRAGHRQKTRAVPAEKKNRSRNAALVRRDGGERFKERFKGRSVRSDDARPRGPRDESLGGRARRRYRRSRLVRARGVGRASRDASARGGGSSVLGKTRHRGCRDFAVARQSVDAIHDHDDVARSAHRRFRRERRAAPPAERRGG